jgi:hypothetical protein
MRRWWLLLTLLLLWSSLVRAQVVPNPPSAGGTVNLPSTTCVNQVGIGLTSAGVLVCGPILPAMAPGLVPAGGDVNPAGQVTATHLALPLPPPQGGTGLVSGTSGGLLYWSTPTTLNVSPVLPLNAPLLGGGPGLPPTSGIRSGTTLELATVLGAKVLGKQLAFDVDGNIVASAVDIGAGGNGGGGGGAVSSVFGRVGAVTAIAGDYTVAQVTNAADVAAANVFTHPTGQSMPQLVLPGSVSGTLTLRAAAVAGTSVLTWPAGSTNFSATGGAGHVVRQGTVGGPFTVAPLALSDIAGSATVCTTTPLCAGYQAALGFTPEDVGNKSASVGLGTSHTLYPTQAAVKTYVDAGLAGKQQALGFTPEDVANKAPGVTLGTSDTLYPTQNAVKAYVDTGLATKQAALGFTPEDVTNKAPSAALGTSSTLYPTQGAVKAYVDTGLAGKQNTLAFTPENVANKTIDTALGTSNTLYPTQGAVKAYVDAGLAGKQQALGFTPENVANKATSTALGTSDALYPTQNAVKVYVDTGLATKQAAVTWGAGLAFAGGVASVASTESGFLSNGGVTPLTCGLGTAGRSQVLSTGEWQYCDGASTAILRSGVPTQTGLRWNATVSSCTTDGNSGKLTITASNEIVCASDIGGTGGGGAVSSVFGRTGAVIGQAGDYTAALVTNAADVTAANVFVHATGQTMTRLQLTGSTSGFLSLRAAAVAGTSIVTWPAGTTDFTATGGSGHVVRQTSTGAAFTVGPLALADIMGGATVCTTTAVCTGYQADLGFTPEDVTNKNTATVLGTSNTAYPTQNAVKVYVDTGLATKQNTLGFTPENVINKATATALGTSDALYPTQNAVKVYVDTGLATKQAALGFTPENVTNKAPSPSLGPSDTLYPTQNAVKVYVDTGLATKQATLGFTPENVTNKTTTTALGTSDVAYPTQNAVKVYVDTGLATKQATLGFTPENVANKSPGTSLGTSDTLYPTQNAVKTYIDGGLAGKQALLGFTPENVTNKNTATVLGTSNTAYPTQNAVKVYVDTGLATKQATVSWGAGLAFAGGVASVASTESGFLTNGGATSLTCGAGTAGRSQVLANGEWQYCDGAATPLLRSGLPTQSGLKWNVTPVACTSDVNGGTLTVNASNEIVCTPDNGGGAGTVDVSGTPVADQLAVWVDANTLTGTNALNLQVTTFDVSGATSTKPMKTGTTPPVACSIGETFFDTDAAATSKFVACTAPNTWTPQGGDGIYEVITNKDPSPTLGLSDTAYPTQGAVKTYVDSSPKSMTNTEVVPRACTLGNAASLTIAPESCDFVSVAELSQSTTFSIAAGSTPTPGQFFSLKIFTTVARALTFTLGSNSFAAEGIPLPTTTATNGYVLYGFQWNPQSSRWAFVATTQTGGGVGWVHLPVSAVTLPTTNAAVLDGSETNMRLLFDATTSECAWWGPFRMNPDYVGSPVFKWQYSMTSATTGGISLNVSVMAVTPGDAVDINNEANYAAVNNCDDTPVPSTPGGIKELSCPLTNNDALAAADLTKIKICRATTDSTDTATGDMEGIAAMLEYAK